MFNILIGKSHKHKYVKCSNCKIIDSISPLYSHPICQLCHQPLKEISEEEYKQKIAYAKKIKEERRKMRENNNINNDINRNYRNIDNNNNNEEDFNNRHRNNSSLHSSKIQFNNNNDNNNNINNINNNNNSNNNNHHHGHHGIQIIKVIRGGNHGNHNIIGIRRDNSSDRENNAGHRINRMIIIRPSTHHHNNNSNNNNNNNNNVNIDINLNNQNVELNSNRNINLNNNNQNIHINNNNQNIQIISNNNNQNPFRIVVQRQHVPNHIFDPNFSLFGSTFDHVFQENFSSNFRSNFRGNFVNELLNILSFNRAELRRSKRQHPISQENAQKLKKFNLTQEYCKKDEKGNYEKPNCCICLEEIELGKETLLLPCGHMFHSKCGFTWLEKSNTCPICRFEIK